MNKLVASMLALGAFTALASQSYAVDCDDTDGASIDWPDGSSDSENLDCADGTSGIASANDNIGANGQVSAVIDGVGPTGQATLMVVGFEVTDLVCQAIATEVLNDTDACDRTPTVWGAVLSND